jgi:peptidoglycan/xylan/chitin deacetylase (PgdA/CDA1 family)
MKQTTAILAVLLTVVISAYARHDNVPTMGRPSQNNHSVNISGKLCLYNDKGEMPEIDFTCITKQQRCYVTKYRDEKWAAISFTYDDGLLEHYTMVAPELEKRGFRGSFWIIGNMVGVEKHRNGPRMSWAQVREMSKRGHDMGSHTWSHPKLMLINDIDSLRSEFTRVDSAFAANGIPKPMTVAYPYNGQNAKVRMVAEKGRIGSRVRQVGHGEDSSKMTPAKLSAWLRQTISKGEWGITMTHGIKTGYDIWYHPEWLWNFYDEVKAKEDSVWVGTLAEVQAYETERLHTDFKVGEKRDKTIITPVQIDAATLDPLHPALSPAIFHEPLTLRIDGDYRGKTLVAKQAGKSLTVTNKGDHILVNINPFGGKITLLSE